MKRVRDSLDEVASTTGSFERQESGFREILSGDHATFKPEFDRYHLYISHACPWANRVSAAISMKGLGDCIKQSVLHPTWRRTRPDLEGDSHSGWAFSSTPITDNIAGCTADEVNHCNFIRDLYEKSGDTLNKFTVPALWDKKTNCIVNNESSEILRMLNGNFDQWASNKMDLYPAALRESIDSVNEWIYHSINNGVYKCGFARTQSSYDTAVDELFEGLDKVEAILAKSRYLVGNTFTEADLRLFMTLVRFDEVYVVYFKCNVRSVSQYPHMRQYMRELFQMPGLHESIHMDHIKTHYFTSHTVLNAYHVVPKGPKVLEDLMLPHNRADLFPV